MANTAWGLAVIHLQGSSCTELLDKMAKDAKRRARQFSAEDLGALFWAFATLSVRPTDPGGDRELNGALELLAREAAGRLRDFAGPWVLVSLAWAMSTIRVGADRALATVVMEAADQLSSEAQQLARLLWCVATARPTDVTLAHVLLEKVSAGLDRIQTQEMASLAWAAAVTMPAQGPSECQQVIVAAVLARLERDQDRVSPQQMVRCAWAAATISYFSESFASSLRDIVKEQAGEMKPADLALAAWAHATWNQGRDALSVELLQEASRQLHDFSAQDLSNLAWAMSTCSVQHEELIVGLATQAQHKVKSLEPQHLCNLVWALSMSSAQLPSL